MNNPIKLAFCMFVLATVASLPAQQTPPTVPNVPQSAPVHTPPPTNPVPMTLPPAPAGPFHYVPLPPKNHDAIDAAAAKLDVLTQRYKELTTQYNQMTQSLQGKFMLQRNILNSLLAEDRKTLGLPDNVQFTGPDDVPATATSPVKPAWTFEVPDSAPPANASTPAATPAAAAITPAPAPAASKKPKKK